MRNLQKDYQFAQDLMYKIGFYLLMHMKSDYHTAWKEDNTPVTNLDLGIGKMVLEEINKEYPEDSVYTEEGSSKGTNSYTWVIDPIDGTQSLELFPTATCCLALVDPEGKSIFSFIYNPHNTQLFSAHRDKSSILDSQPIQVSTSSELKRSYVFFGSRPRFDTKKTNGELYDALEKAGAKMINVRSLAFGCCMVAKGKAGAALIAMDTPFEIASAKLLVENAGGMVTDYAGNPIDRVDTMIKGAILSNGKIHQELLDIILN